MRCESAIRRLGAYALDELSPPDRAELRAHLDACTRCRAQAARLAAAADGVRGLAEIAPSSDRREKALDAMRRGAAERLARPRWERVARSLLGRRIRWSAGAFIAASVAAVAVVVFVRRPALPAAETFALTAETVSGPVDVERPGLAVPLDLRRGAAVQAGDTVKVREGARALLRSSNGGLIECRGGTSLRLERPVAGTGDILLTLNYGALWCELYPLPRGHYVIRDARDRRATVVGTKFEIVSNAR